MALPTTLRVKYRGESTPRLVVLNGRKAIDGETNDRYTVVNGEWTRQGGKAGRISNSYTQTTVSGGGSEDYAQRDLETQNFITPLSIFSRANIELTATNSIAWQILGTLGVENAESNDGGFARSGAIKLVFTDRDATNKSFSFPSSGLSASDTVKLVYKKDKSPHNSIDITTDEVANGYTVIRTLTSSPSVTNRRSLFGASTTLDPSIDIPDVKIGEYIHLAFVIRKTSSSGRLRWGTNATPTVPTFATDTTELQLYGAGVSSDRRSFQTRFTSDVTPVNTKLYRFTSPPDALGNAEQVEYYGSDVTKETVSGDYTTQWVVPLGGVVSTINLADVDNEADWRGGVFESATQSVQGTTISDIDALGIGLKALKYSDED